MDIIIAVVKVNWRDTLLNDLHDTVTYVITHLGDRSNRKVRAEINKWLKIQQDAEQVYNSTQIIKFERTTTDDSNNPLLANGFVHVNLENMSVSYYGVNDDEDEEGEQREVNDGIQGE